MKTVNTLLKAFAATAILALSFNATAAASNAPSDSNSSSPNAIYYVINDSDNVLAHDYDLWEVTLLGGKHYTIVVDGDGDTDLDVYLYDEDGNEIDKDTDNTDYCICEVTPRWTGDFTIKVRNYGDVYNHYTIKVYR